MQTFLPYPSFRRSAEVLDDRRLGKQRVEVLQVLRALVLADYGWANHPAVAMWRGHLAALVTYGVTVTDAWIARGYGDTVRPQLVEFVAPGEPPTEDELWAAGAMPAWLGDERIHRSHRSALLRKDPERYGPLFDDVPDDLDYVWPQAPPRADGGTFSAWVVRPPSSEALAGFAERSAVWLSLLPGEDGGTASAPPGSGRTKRHRQVARITHQMAVGDPVVVPAGEELLVGVVAGEATVDAPSADGDAAPAVVRPVVWRGRVARRSLRRPALLQDPQLVFALTDEPEVAGLAAAAGG